MLRPADVAQRLNIPASTLRRWSYYFADYLPTHAQEPNGAATRSHRRYSEEDVRVLTKIKELLGRGLTYEEVGLHLAERTSDPERAGEATVVEVLAETIESSDGDGGSETEDASETTERQAIVNRPDEADSRPELANLIAETLFSLSDSQQIILSGQQTARQLLGVVLQDNFNLKEENSRLRERILEAERKIFELKREVDSNQTHDRERMRQMESYLFELQRRLDSLAPQVVRHASPAAGVRPAPAPVATSAPVASAALVAAPAPAAVAPAAQPVPPAIPPQAAVPSGAAVADPEYWASSAPPVPGATSPAAAPPPALTPAESSSVPPPPPEPTSSPVQAAEAPLGDETEPISPFAPPRPPAAEATPAVAAQPEAAIPPPPPLPPQESIVQVAPVAVTQPAGPPPVPTSSGRWQRFSDWLFGRNMEE